MKGRPQAAVVRGDFGPGVVYLGYQPDRVLCGGPGETRQLEEELGRLANAIGRFDEACGTMNSDFAD